MKQLLSTIAIIALFATAKHGYSQTDNAFAFNAAKAITPATSNASKINAANVSLKTQKDFEKSFRNISNEKWFKVPGGFIANFLSKGIDFRVTYNEKGNWLYNLLTYPEDNLPVEVRKMIKSQYYDYDIQFCNEYQLSNATLYIVKMQDDKTMKTLKIADGEMELIAVYKRS